MKAIFEVSCPKSLAWMRLLLVGVLAGCTAGGASVPGPAPTAPELPAGTTAPSATTAATEPAPEAPPAVHTQRPTEQDIELTASIWDWYQLSNGLDLVAPGSREFSITVTPDKQFIWPFYWCASDEDTLLENLESMSVNFLVDGVPIPADGILEFDKETENWRCRFWTTMLADWTNGSLAELTVDYRFVQDVFDGVSNYPAGEYSYVLLVIAADEGGALGPWSPVSTSSGLPQPLRFKDSLAWSPKGNQIAQGTEFGLALYSTGLGPATLVGEPGRGISGVAWSPDGLRLASAEVAGQVTVWDAHTRKPLATLTGFGGQPTSIAWSPDGKKLAAGSEDGTIRIWDADTYSLASTIEQRVIGLAWSPASDRLAGLDELNLYVWDAVSGQELFRGEVISSGKTVDWTPDGRYLITTSLERWEADTRSAVAPLETIGCASGSMVFSGLSPDGSQMAGIGVQVDGNVACIFPTSSPENLEAWRWLPEGVALEALAWSPDSKTIVTSGDPGLYWGSEDQWIVSPEDTRLGLWDADTGKATGSARNPLLQRALEWPAPQEPDLQRLCSSNRDSWTWRVLNPNPFEVEVGWELQSVDPRPGERGIVVPAAQNGQPGEVVLVTARQAATDRLKFFTGDGGEWKANVTAGGIACTP